MIARLRSDEGGWAVITAIGLMAIVLAFGLSTYAQVDTQQQASGISRTKETAFNAAEAALSAQIFALAQDWPGKGKGPDPYPTCTAASASPRCPSAQALMSATASPDARGGVAWQTQIRDNGSGATKSFYDDRLTQGAAAYDANDDGRVWVRAQATVARRTRTLVALVRVEQITEAFPRAAVIAGRVRHSNNGNKILLDGREGSLPVVSVRCTPQAGETTPCLGHALGTGPNAWQDLQAKLAEQIAPNVTLTGYSGAEVIDAAARERLKATAVADGTYYATCPATPPSGRVVWIVSGACTWTSNHVVNSPAAPGFLVLENATAFIAGTVDFHGVVYHPNPSRSTAELVQVQGNARVFGGVLIDGEGTLVIGSSKENVTLRNGAYDRIRSYASAGMIQNTWREIVPAS